MGGVRCRRGGDITGVWERQAGREGGREGCDGRRKWNGEMEGGRDGEGREDGKEKNYGGREGREGKEGESRRENMWFTCVRSGVWWRFTECQIEATGIMC